MSLTLHRTAGAILFGLMVCEIGCDAADDARGDAHAGVLSTQVLALTAGMGSSTARSGPIYCRPGASAGACQAQPFDTTHDLAFSGAGAAPATAKDCYGAAPTIHAAAFANDGEYGNGSSWLADSANSWVDIDLGAAILIDSVRFGRDRTGVFDDRDPGQFLVMTATAPHAFSTVYDSAAHGFSGQINGDETVTAAFAPVMARYVRLQVSAPGAAIDEIEVQPALRSVPSAPLTGSLLCRPGFGPPGCYAHAFESTDNLAAAAGPAGFAVASGTLPGYPTLHNSQHLNDGQFGNGSSWIANTADAWIKIDLGRRARVNAVHLGRDRLGYFDDRDVGQLRILVAETDNVYATGDDTLDSAEYTQVFDSTAYGTSDLIVGTQTTQVRFAPRLARYVKIQVGAMGAALDEIEVFGTVEEDDPAVFLEVGAPAVRWVEALGGFWDGQRYLQGDFNGDGRADIARVWNDGTDTMIDVFEGSSGEMTWTRWGNNLGGFSPVHSYLAGDFDGDSRADILRVHDDYGMTSIDVLRSTGATFVFERWSTQQSAFDPANRYVAGDVDGNGRDDLIEISASAAGTLLSLYTAPAAQFSRSVWIDDATHGPDAAHFVAGDFNGDGKASVARVRRSTGSAASVDVFDDTPNGATVSTWMTDQGHLHETSAVFADDFNGDGKADIIRVDHGAAGAVAEAFVAEGNQFAPTRFLDASTAATRFVTGDFDNDGRAELAGIFGRGGLTFIDMMGVPVPPGEFGQSASRWAYGSGGFSNDQAYFAGDFDGDGSIDVARVFDDTQTSIDVHTNTGNEFVYSRWVTQSGEQVPDQILVSGDFDGDGEAEIAKLFNDSGLTSIDVYGDVAGQGARWQTRDGGHWVGQKFVAGDFNDDGRDDIAKIFGDYGYTSVDVYLALPTGDGFAASTRWMTQRGGFWAGQTYIAGDFTDDGRTDIARIFGDVHATHIDMLIAQPDQTFIDPRWLSTPHPFGPSQQFVAGNFDGLGADDLIKVHNRGDGRTGLRLFATQGSTFDVRPLMESTIAYSRELKAVAGDVDQDGIDEVITIHGNGEGETNMDVYGANTTLPDAGRVHFPNSDLSLTRAELATQLAADNLTLVVGSELQTDECGAFYIKDAPTGSTGEQGVLVCRRNDEVLVKPIAGGCRLDGESIVGGPLACSWGVVGAEIDFDLGGANVTWRVSGPGARACASVSSSGACMGVGAELWQTSFTMTDSRGNGGGMGIHGGFGATGNGGYQNGVLRFGVGLGIGAGVKFNVSVNVADAIAAGETAIYYGEMGFSYARAGVNESLSTLGDAADAVGDVAEDVAGAVGDVAGTLAGAIGDAFGSAASSIGSFFGI